MRLASFTFDALFRLQNEVHIDGIVVGVAIPRVDDIGGDDLNIIGHEEAVDRHAEGRLLVVGFVGRAAGGDGMVDVKRHDEGEPVGDRPLGDGLRPGVVLAARDAEDLGRIAEQVLIEVAARDAVVAVSYSASISAQSICSCSVAMVPSDV